MNENAQIWVDALRSGEFTQAHGGLRANDTHCCLGVACELYRRATGNGEWKEYAKSGSDVYYRFEIGSESSSTGLLPEVKEWLGVNPALPGSLVRYGDSTKEFCSLAGHNDNGKTFEEIADIVEENADEIFPDA